ncbi:hypothetical protein DL762_004235 [Monosporascus cannonballus]|uniref:Uncharacterized protein n=1 Tax=Monosporascus cannonballus TaxID=155416 RepID=A0ABY0H8B4_9PEZI|nr:hypothetical protein DL762_004235 [Monosporascus cannonballus]RYP00623.1 hypothetical protein DL763_000677 [Monosporascus cannonballus]
MRSRPYKPPTPLLPLLDDPSAYLLKSDRRPSSEREVPMSALDHDTGVLLPRKARQHRVRVQGKVALVRSVSVADLKFAGHPSPRSSHGVQFDSGVGGGALTRRSLDDGSETDEDVSERDTQFRAYGIGGAGNIRKSTPSSYDVMVALENNTAIGRPTEVMGASSRKSPSLSTVLPSSLSATITTPGVIIEKKRSKIRDFLSRVSDRKVKGNASGTPPP